MTRILLASVFLGITGLGLVANAQEADDERLMIVNGYTGHVVYDDGRDDLFCVTRRYVVGYDAYGRRVHRRVLRCR